jgi:rubrerythrin
MIMDRFWGMQGEPLLYEGERQIISADNIKIGGTSKGDSKLKDLNKGSFYVTNVRVIFISMVKKKAKLVSEKYDGLSIFYSDMANAEKVGPGGRSLKIECQYKTHKFIKKTAARIYFKNIPSDVADEVINRVIESQKDRIEEKKVAPKKKETVQEKQPPPEPQKPEVPADIQYMINELEDEDIELQCPKCGTFIKYKPGLDVCPACKEKVKFFAD